MRLRRPTVTASAAPAPGSRSRLLLLFACLATAVASVALPGQQPHRTELAAVALLAALLLLRRHHHATAHPDRTEADTEETDTEEPEPEAAAHPAERPNQDQHTHTERPEGEHPAAQSDLEWQAGQPEVFQTPARRRFQSRRSHAHELALAQISQTLAAQERRLAALNRAQTVAKLQADDHLDALHERLAELETRTDQHDEALQAIHDHHAHQLNRLHHSITRHTNALQQLENTLGP